MIIFLTIYIFLKSLHLITVIKISIITLNNHLLRQHLHTSNYLHHDHKKREISQQKVWKKLFHTLPFFILVTIVVTIIIILTCHHYPCHDHLHNHLCHLLSHNHLFL